MTETQVQGNMILKIFIFSSQFSLLIAYFSLNISSENLVVNQENALLSMIICIRDTGVFESVLILQEQIRRAYPVGLREKKVFLKQLQGNKRSNTM